MAERLLVVEEAFVARGRGILLMPRFTASEGQAGTLRVLLRRPDGSSLETAATVEVAHMRGALAPWAMYRLTDLTPEAVPAGTELWTIDS